MEKDGKVIEGQFWKAKPKAGRKKHYEPEELWDAACEYFQWVDENPLKEQRIYSTKDGLQTRYISKKRVYTQLGLQIFLGISTNTFCNYANGNGTYKEFPHIISNIKEVIFNQKFEGASSGFFKENFIARDLGLVDKKKVELETDIEINIGGEDDD